MRLSELQRKDIVNMNTGKKIGKIIDIEVNEIGNIDYMIVDASRIIKSIFSSDKEMNIKFNDISKFGEDVILVDIT